MKGILVDTSIVIDFLRQKDKDQTVLVNLEKSSHQLFVSIITHTESYSGKSIWERKEAMEALKLVLSSKKILPIDEKISEKAGEIRAKYDKHLGDAVVAATALYHKLELATLNIKDFKKISGLKLLSNLTRGF